MDAKLKRKWVKALLSGKYEQGKQYLHADGKYCCLGVLMKVVGDEPMAYWTEVPSYVPRQHNHFVELNDAGVPFDMIAGLIETAL